MTPSAIPVAAVAWLDGVGAWFTGRPDPATGSEVGQPGNLSHHRPHLPAQLARDREDVFARMQLDPEDVHFMRQVHGAQVGVVTAETVRGAELRDVDALVTREPGRALAVQVADCVPVLLATDAGPVAAVHAGRRGLVAGVVPAAVAAMGGLGAPPDTLHALVGPAIGGCCYEVDAELQRDVVARHPAAAATTTWGTPSLDLPAAVQRQLEDAGVALTRYGGCSACTGSWFSHRRDPEAGRQVGVVVRLAAA